MLFAASAEQNFSSTLVGISLRGSSRNFCFTGGWLIPLTAATSLGITYTNNPMSINIFMIVRHFACKGFRDISTNIQSPLLFPGLRIIMYIICVTKLYIKNKKKSVTGPAGTGPPPAPQTAAPSKKVPLGPAEPQRYFII